MAKKNGVALKPKKNTVHKISQVKNEVDRLLNKVSPATLHKIVDERSKSSEPLAIFVEGGIVQAVGRLTPKGFVGVEYDLMDYDIFDGSSDEEIKDYFERRSPELRAYMQKFLPKEYAEFQERIASTSQSNPDSVL